MRQIGTVAVAAALALALRLAVGGGGGSASQASLWLLRLLLVLLAATICLEAGRFLRDRWTARRRGEPILPERALLQLLVFVLIAGLGCRLFTLGSGEQGVIGWVGAVLVVLSLVGLGVVAFRRDTRRFSGRRMTLSSPYIRYGLLVVGITSLAAATLAGAGSIAAGIFSAVFWLCFLGLVAHFVNSAMRRRGQRSAR